jgi:tetratricopeptide (TPR) repeat protein
MLKWFSAREATDVGVALADDFVLQSASGSGARPKNSGPAAASGRDLQKFMQKFLQRVDRDARPLELNLFKRAKLANSFKWRLLEKGLEKELVEELTQALVLRLTTDGAQSPGTREPGLLTRRSALSRVQALLLQGTEQAARGAHADAAQSYEEVLALDPRNAGAHNNLGVALCNLGRYVEAAEQFRQAIGIKDNYADAQFNLGSLLRSQGRYVESEQPLRRALKIKPIHIEAQISLAATLVNFGRMRESRELLDKALRTAPRHVDGLLTMGQLAAREGRFAEAEGWFNRALEVDPKAPHAWVGLAALRRMTSADAAWLRGAEQSADGGLQPMIEANVRYAIGKYYDEVGDFGRAFRSYQRANELVKTGAEPYDRDARTRFVDGLIQAYPRAMPGQEQPGAADSALAVFVVGMPRSGTTLIEQIVASHPAVHGAGELEFWGFTVRKHEARLQREPPGEALRRKLAAKYLRVLAGGAPGALRVVDKSPFNYNYLGIIHAVLPQARVIHVRRDPIDTCLSCYFQDFPPALNFTLDLADLGHYYREYRRLMDHWRATLPPGVLLDVPYEELIADQWGWSRRMIEFLGLPWDDRCLSFHSTDRSVLTASYWQVRQRIYSSSIGRWRNYEKFIGPLLALKGLG